MAGCHLVGQQVDRRLRQLWSFVLVPARRGDDREVAVPDAGSQFRSRDLFPPVVADLGRGEFATPGHTVGVGLVPGPPERAVAHVDGHGNLKTTWTDAPAELGQLVEVSVAGAAVVAVVTDVTFAVRQGEMSFAPGSSGWRRPDGSDRRFYQLLLRGGNAADRLGPPGGSTDGSQAL